MKTRQTRKQQQGNPVRLALCPLCRINVRVVGKADAMRYGRHGKPAMAFCPNSGAPVILGGE